MLKDIDLKNLLVVDVETVPLTRNLDDLSAYEQSLWEAKRGKYMEEDDNPDEFYFNNAGILAEFGKIICISAGYFVQESGAWNFRIKSFYGREEKQVLSDFVGLLKTLYDKNKNLSLVGHNIKEFDIPYISRRLLINRLELPEILDDLMGKEPWKNKTLDTMQLWKFGDYKNYISLKLLAHVLDITSPKDDIDGSQVAGVFYEEADGLERIKNYCQKDIVAVAQIILRFKSMPLLEEGNISFVN